MSRTWERRPPRRGKKHAEMSNMRYARRTCCGTHSREPHRPECRRDEAMCGAKTGFEGRAAASRKVDSLSVETGLIWRAYRCPHCGLWHLTSHATGGPD